MSDETPKQHTTAEATASAADSDAVALSKRPLRKANAASRAAAAAAAAAASNGASSAAPVAPASPSRKRRADGTEKAAAASSPHDPQHQAASRIQALVRGAKARTLRRQESLWSAWNELDWKEEAELMKSHAAFEALKAAVQNRKKEDEGATAAAAASSKKRSGSPTTPAKKKGGRGGKAASADAESALIAELGLGWREKDPLTHAWVEQLMDTFKRNVPLPASLVLRLLGVVTPLLKALPNIVPVSIPGGRLTVVGDLHGQLDDLLAVFKLQGLPSPRNRFIFNGDLVDRGQASCECVLTLLAWKVLAPGHVFINRGNHEARDINGRDGFEKECHTKYGKKGAEIFDAFSACFAALPLVHIIEQQVFVTHGGLYSKSTTLAQIARIDRFHEVPPSGSLMEEGLWSDPQSSKGRAESPRGAGLLFGPDVTKEFLARNAPLNLIVRSHECMTKGYKLHHHDQVITVFSASNYTGTVGNDGALIVFERDGGTTALGAGAAGTGTTTPNKAAAAQPPASPRGSRASGGGEAAVAAAPPSPVRRTTRTPKHETPLTVPAAAAASASASGVVPLKRTIVTFYAAAKEKSASYRVAPDVSSSSNMQTDVVSKLLHLISDHRLALIDYWSSRSQRHSSGVSTITRSVWATGLKTCLGLKLMPFSAPWFQELLGLPKLGVDGSKGGPVDFMNFLMRFRPVNLVVLRAQRLRRSASSMGASISQDGQSQESMMGLDDMDGLGEGDSSQQDQDDEATVASLQQILELLHRKRFELESLFRFLDVDGDERISHAEFREGMKSLQAQLGLGCKFTDEQINALLKYIDENGDGEISYSEFFESFQLDDKQFAATLERSKSIRDGRQGASSSSAHRATSGHTVGDDVDENATTPPNSPPPPPPADGDDALWPQHANDTSPPHRTRELNDTSDHDETSSSHMSPNPDDESHSHIQTRSRSHTDEDTIDAPADAPADAPVTEEHTHAEEPHAKRRKTGSQ